jgi:cell division protein FtsB
MTDKDKKLLIFLAFFAVIAIFGFVIIKPLVEKNAELLVQVNDLQTKKTDFESKKSELPMLRVENTEKQQKIAELKSGFNDMMQSQEIDNLLTEKALSAGLLASSLTIEMPKEPLKLDVYQNSEIALDAEPVTEATTYVKNSEAAADAVEAAAGTGDDDSEAAAASGGEIAQQTLVSAANVRFELKGNIESLKNVVDDFANNDPAIRLTGVAWSGIKEDDLTNGTASLSLEINMCDKDQQAEGDQVEVQ